MSTSSTEVARTELCERLLPDLLALTGDYFDVERPHPYLEGLANGGVLYSNVAKSSAETENLTEVNAIGFRDTLEPEKFPKIGIPKKVALGGLLWVVLARETELFRDSSKMPAEKRAKQLDHSFNYWDGEQWTTRRLIPKSDPSRQPWETMWEASELKPEEILAIQATAKQTRFLHEIADVFGEDWAGFEATMMDLTDKPEQQDVLSHGLSDSAYIRHTLGANGIRPYMIYYSTVFQYLRFLLPTVSRLSERESASLDAGQIMAANYHKNSLPSTPETLATGENITLSNIHPPVPVDF